MGKEVKETLGACGAPGIFDSLLPNKPSLGPPLPAFFEVRWPKWIKHITEKSREPFGDEGYIINKTEDSFFGKYLVREYHLKKEIVSKERANQIARSLASYCYDIVHGPKSVDDEWVFSTSEPTA